MTLEEAKKILKKEGFRFQLLPSGAEWKGKFHPFEKPTVMEAVKILFENGLMPWMDDGKAIERSSRLFKEHGWVPVDHNPALHEAASELNDAMLDEQAKKIEDLSSEVDKWYDKYNLEEAENDELKKRNAVLADDLQKIHDKTIAKDDKIKHLEDYVASRNKIIAEQSAKISSLNAKVTKKNKVISKKSRELKDKDAVLSDVAEELRLSKVREEKLTEVCQKYLKEIECLRVDFDKSEKFRLKTYNSCVEKDIEINKLREQLANITVNNVNAQALKSAESALCYKDEVIEDLRKELDEAKNTPHPTELSSWGYMWGFIDSIFGKHLFDDDENYRIFNALTDTLMKMGVSRKNALTEEKQKELQEMERKRRAEGCTPLHYIANMLKKNKRNDEPCGEPKRNIGHVVFLKGDDDPTLLRNVFKDKSDIVIPKDNPVSKKPTEDDIMEGCKEMLRLNIKLMRDLFDE